MSRELDRHTIDVQDEIINELRGEIERLRGLMKRSLFHLIADCRDDDLIDEIAKEVSDGDK